MAFSKPSSQNQWENFVFDMNFKKRCILDHPSWVTAAPNGAIVLSLPADLRPFLTALHSYTHKIRVKRVLTAVTSSALVCSILDLGG